MTPIANLPSNIILMRILGNLAKQGDTHQLQQSPLPSVTSSSIESTSSVLAECPVLWKGFLGLKPNAAKVCFFKEVVVAQSVEHPY